MKRAALGALYRARGTREIVLIAVLSACSAEPTDPRIEYLPEMIDSLAYDSFAPNRVTRDGKTLIAPAKGTIPRGFAPFRYGAGDAEAERAGRDLENPLPPTAGHVARGEKLFSSYCRPCHGPRGEGDGPVAGRFPTPPSLGAAHAKAMPDGRLYHVIARGQGLMPPHAIQVRGDDRWKLVHFIRSLQQPPAPGAQAAGGAG